MSFKTHFLTTREEHLSKETCTSSKGFFAILVLIHHLYQYSGLLRETIPGAIFQAFGYLSVAAFFFFSGYGLSTSYEKKGTSYVHSFPKRKILPFYCIIIFFTVLYQLLNLLLEIPFSFSSFFRSLSFGGTIVINGWYMQVQLAFYILFFLVFFFFKKKKTQLIALSFVCISYILLLYLLGFSPLWYESAGGFFLGVAYRFSEEKIVNYLRPFKRWLCLFLISCVCFCLTFIGGSSFNPLVVIRIILKMLSAVAFLFAFLLLLNRLSLQNFITKFFARFSLEIYMVQGLFLALYRSNLIYIEAPFAYITLVIISTLLFSLIIHPVIVKINAIFGGKTNEHKIRLQ